MATKKNEKTAPKADKGASKPGADKGKPAPKAEAKPVAPPVAAKPAPAAAAAAPVVQQVPPTVTQEGAHGFRRKLVGRVTSDKMNKTVTVEVVRSAVDPVYKKYVRHRDRYKA